VIWRIFSPSQDDYHAMDGIGAGKPEIRTNPYRKFYNACAAARSTLNFIKSEKKDSARRAPRCRPASPPTCAHLFHIFSILALVKKPPG
jgi:hypothetical protein